MRALATSMLLVTVLLAGCRPPGWGEDEGDDAVTVDATPGPTPDAATADAATSCERAFRLEGHASASSVWLTGDFVAWAGDPTVGAVTLALGGDGAWTGTHTFPAGTYQYKFIVDGTSWIADPGNPSSVDDGFGGKNSLYSCTP